MWILGSSLGVTDLAIGHMRYTGTPMDQNSNTIVDTIRQTV